MDLTTFEQSLRQAMPPEELRPVLKALWLDAKGDWHQAHRIVQDLDDPQAAWVHALLHREEGDQWNADYWYRRAGRPRSTASLEQEWREIAAALLGD